jgi:hypothetical protein
MRWPPENANGPCRGPVAEIDHAKLKAHPNIPSADFLQGLVAAKRPGSDIERLELIADWRADLTTKIKRAQMRFELVGLDQDHTDQLGKEVAAFKKVCRCLTLIGRGSAA